MLTAFSAALTCGRSAMAIMAGASSAADLEEDADVHRERGDREDDRQDQHSAIARVHSLDHPAVLWFRPRCRQAKGGGKPVAAPAIGGLVSQKKILCIQFFAC